MRSLLTLLMLSSLLIPVRGAGATALDGQATNDSVCDLGTDASSTIDRYMAHVPALTPELEEVYTRLALRFATASCRDGQILILRSAGGSALDRRYFEHSTAHLCKVADVQQLATGSEEHPHGFEMRCTVSKIDSARAWLTAAETARSTESMIDAGASAQPERCKLIAGMFWVHTKGCIAR